MTTIWAAILAIPAAWFWGVAVAFLIDTTAGQLPILTILLALPVLLLVAVIPWSAATVRLTLMQWLAGTGLVLMLLA